MQVIPFGYSAPNARETLDKLMQQDPRAILVDIRYSTVSKNKPEWSQYALRCQYGSSRYVPIQELGNENYYSHGPVKIHKPDEGLARLIKGLEKGYKPILLCTCADYTRCHRKIVVEMLQQKLPEVQVVHPGSQLMQCLSISQPYAHWLANPDLFINAGIRPKTIENRNWTTRYRGPLLIHADMKFEDDALSDWSKRCPELLSIVPLDERAYKLGAIIGIADLVDVIEESDDPWFVGPYGFVLANARPIKPVELCGLPKLFDVTMPLEKLAALEVTV